MTITDKGELRDEVLKFLQKNKVAVIATASKEGVPESATVTYLFDDDFNFYFITRKQSRKLINILENANVSLVIGTNAEIPVTVQIQGVAEIIEHPDEYTVSYLMKKINLTHSEWWPLIKLEGTDYVFVKVKSEWVRWLDLDKKEYPAGYDEHFQQVLP